MINGLYSIHVNLLDGRTGRGSGVIVFRDGKLLGGDAYLFYTGSYTTRDNAMRGEVIINQHTPSPDERPLFGGQQVSIGFSGKIDGNAGTMSGTALVGKASVIFEATLRKMADT